MKKFKKPNLFNRLRWRKKAEPKTKWNTKEKEEILAKLKPSFLPPITDETKIERTFKPTTFKAPKIYHIHGLRTLKRVFATILLFVHGIFFLGSLTNPMGIAFSILFFLDCFIFIDYVWRTKKSKVEIDW